jgi:hypothetical protein
MASIGRSREIFLSSAAAVCGFGGFILRQFRQKSKFAQEVFGSSIESKARRILSMSFWVLLPALHALNHYENFYKKSQRYHQRPNQEFFTKCFDAPADRI